MVAICEYVGFHKNVNKLCTGFENFEVSPSTLFSKGNPKRLPLIFGKVNYDYFFSIKMCLSQWCLLFSLTKR